MKRLFILAPAILLVASCSRGPDRIQAGQWEMVVQLTSIDVPGAPPEAQAEMRQGLNRPQTTSVCITPEQATNPMGELRRMIAQSRQNPNCQFTDDTYGGGVIRFRATCRQPGGPGRADLGLEGSFTTTTAEARFTLSGEGLPMGPGAQSLRMGATVRGRRVADCTAQPARPIQPVPTVPAPAPQQ